MVGCHCIIQGEPQRLFTMMMIKGAIEALDNIKMRNKRNQCTYSMYLLMYSSDVSDHQKVSDEIFVKFVNLFL